MKEEAGTTSTERATTGVLNLVSDSTKQTQSLGRHLAALARPGDLLLLVGGLGAGKTCLTQGIAWGLGVSGHATSPSFVVINEYQGRLPLYHVDLYRLDQIEEITELGLDDYLYGRGLCVIEWAEKALSLLPAEHLLIEMGFLADTSRSLRLNPSGDRYLEMLSELKQRTRRWKSR